MEKWIQENMIIPLEERKGERLKVEETKRKQGKRNNKVEKRS